MSKSIKKLCNISLFFLVQSCSYTYIAPNIETKINSYGNEQDFVFDGKA